MRNLTNLAAFAAAMLLAGAAVAGDDKPAGDQPKPKKICRVETLSNSHIPERRICRTEAEWAAQGEDDARKADQTLRGGRNSQ